MVNYKKIIGWVIGGIIIIWLLSGVFVGLFVKPNSDINKASTTKKSIENEKDYGAFDDSRSNGPYEW